MTTGDPRPGTGPCADASDGSSESASVLVGRDAFAAVEPLWRHLTEDGRATPFQTYEWARAWLDHIGRDTEPWLVVRGGARPLLLPLALRRARGLRWLELLGQGPSDYLGPLPVGLDEEGARRLASAIGSVRGAFDVLDLRGWSSDDGARHAFAGGLPGRTAERLYEPCPTIDTTGGWDEYLKGRTKKFRANLKRTARRAEQAGAYRIDRETIDAALFDELVAVERSSWKWQNGSAYLQDDRLRAFLRAVLLESSLAHEIWTLRIADELAAFAVVFPSAHVRHYYLPSFKAEFPDVGSQLLRIIVEDTFSSRFEEFDFLQGDEGYKRPWTTGARSVHEIAGGGRPFVGGALVRMLETRWRLARSERAKQLRQRAMKTWATWRGRASG